MRRPKDFNSGEEYVRYGIENIPVFTDDEFDVIELRGQQ